MYSIHIKAAAHKQKQTMTVVKTDMKPQSEVKHVIHPLRISSSYRFGIRRCAAQTIRKNDAEKENKSWK